MYVYLQVFLNKTLQTGSSISHSLRKRVEIRTFRKLHSQKKRVDSILILLECSLKSGISAPSEVIPNITPLFNIYSVYHQEVAELLLLQASFVFASRHLKGKHTKSGQYVEFVWKLNFLTSIMSHVVYCILFYILHYYISHRFLNY